MVARHIHTLINGGNPETIETMSIETLDPTGVVVNRWVLTDSHITSISYGGLDYAVDDFVEITITIQPGNCVLEELD